MYISETPAEVSPILHRVCSGESQFFFFPPYYQINQQRQISRSLTNVNHMLPRVVAFSQMFLYV